MHYRQAPVAFSCIIGGISKIHLHYRSLSVSSSCIIVHYRWVVVALSCIIGNLKTSFALSFIIGKNYRMFMPWSGILICSRRYSSTNVLEYVLVQVLIFLERSRSKLKNGGNCRQLEKGRI